MPDQLQDIVQRMVAAGESEDNIATVIHHYQTTQKPAAQPSAPEQSKGDLGRYGGYKMIGDYVLNNPVQSLAMLGGMIAAPFTGGASVPAAMAASGLGAAGGAGVGAIAGAAMGNEGGPKTAGDVAKTMAAEGAAGAIGEGVGQGINKLLRVGGKLVYKAALRPSMALQREFGDVAEIGLREGARVGDSGAKMVAEKLGESAQQAKQMVEAAEQAGASPITTKEVASEFKPVMEQGRTRVQLGRPDERPAIVERLKSFSGRNPNGISLTKAQELKREAQDLASRAYRAEEKGGTVAGLTAEADKAQARGLRKGIEARVPGIAEVNSRTQELIGLDRALEDASMRNVPSVLGLRSFMGDFIPSMSSAAAIGAHRAGQTAIPAAGLKAALIAALGGDE